MQAKNSVPRTLLAFAGIALLLPLAACSGRTDSAANVYTFTEGAMDVGAEVGNRSLDRQIELRNPISTRVGDRLQVQFELYNDHSRQKEVEYTVEWFDANGFRVPYIEQWKPMEIGATSVETITLAAPTESAVRARVQVRARTDLS
jgi:uncharacterized protein YcfL